MTRDNEDDVDDDDDDVPSGGGVNRAKLLYFDPVAL